MHYIIIKWGQKENGIFKSATSKSAKKGVETRRKNGTDNKGKHPWNFGLTKEDIRVYNNTTYFRENNPVKREEIRLKISKANKGHLIGDLNPAKREEARLKITLGLIKAFKEGRKNSAMEKNPMWKGGLSFEPYTTDWTRELKRIIRERDKQDSED